MRAKVFIQSHGPADCGGRLGPAFLKKTRFHVMTWHGLPVKTITLLRPSIKKRTAAKRIRTLNKYCLHLSYSPFYSYLYSAIRGVDIRKLHVTGYPRLDSLFTSEENDLKKVHGKVLPESTTKILYAPTYRENTNARFFPFSDLDSDDLNRFLVKENLTVFLRSHVNDQNELPELDSKRLIQFGSDIEPDITRVLKCFDILITDYSGLYYEFLLLNRPMIFIPYDLEEFQRTRGLLFDYETVTPGEKVLFYRQFKAALEKILAGNDAFQKEREILCNIFHSYKDGFSTERTVAKMRDMGIIPK